MSEKAVKESLMIRRGEAVSVDTPFGEYQPDDYDVREAEVARMMNSTPPDSIIEMLSPDDVINAITPLAKYKPLFLNGDKPRITLQLHLGELSIAPFTPTPWSHEYPVDKLWLELIAPGVRVPSVGLRESIGEMFREGAVLAKQDGTLLFKKALSCEMGITQENFLTQLNSFIREAEMTIEDVAYGSLHCENLTPS